MDVSSLVLKILQDPRLKLPPLTDPDRVAEGMANYLALLGKWNSRINLTSDKDPQTLVTRHVFDSLLYFHGLDAQGDTADIGSGAGFPGIPIKLVDPGRCLVLVEGQRKRASFLEEVVRRLGLSGVKVIHSRAEDLPPLYNERFEFVLFKAVAPLADCLRIAAPLLSPGGRVVIKKEQGDAVASGGDASLRPLPPIPIESYSGVSSQLTIFQKCST